MAVEKLYTVDETAEILQVTANTVRRNIRQKRIRASKIGKSYRIKESDLQAFLDNKTTVQE